MRHDSAGSALSPPPTADKLQDFAFAGVKKKRQQDERGGNRGGSVCRSDFVFASKENTMLQHSAVREEQEGLCVPETGTEKNKSRENKEQSDCNYRRSNHPGSVSGGKWLLQVCVGMERENKNVGIHENSWCFLIGHRSHNICMNLCAV